MRVLLMCFMPDNGHVAPLLRIAAALASSGHSVHCIATDESALLASSYGIPHTSIGAASSGTVLRARESFRASNSGALLRLPGDLKGYFFGVIHSLSQGISKVPAIAAELAPDLAIADSHVFLGWYYHIASLLNIPLVINYSSGSLCTFQSIPVQLYGPSANESRLKLRPRLNHLCVKALVKVQNSRARLFGNRSEELEAAKTTFPGVQFSHLPNDGERRIPVLKISAGLGVIERELCQGSLTIPNDVECFGPLLASPNTELPAALSTWMDKWAAKRIVYVSFGTMVRPTARALAKILRAIDRAGLAALWAMPKEHHRLLRGIPLPSHVRFESFVPQRAVLAHPNLACCVTHAGSGTVQESLAAKKPLLCIPAMWDQFFNAHIIERLGVGEQLHWWSLTEKSLVRALLKITSPEYERATARVSDELARHASAERVVERICGFAEANRGAASLSI